MRTQGWSFVMGLGVAATAVGLAGLGAHHAGYRMMQPVEAPTCPVLQCPAPPPQETCAAEEEDGDDEDEADVEEGTCPAPTHAVNARDSRKARSHYEDANHAMLLGNFDQAVAHGKAALALDPGLSDAHKVLGVALSREQKFCEALDHYRTYMACNPQSPQVERIRAIIQSINKETDCAR